MQAVKKKKKSLFQQRQRKHERMLKRLRYLNAMGGKERHEQQFGGAVNTTITLQLSSLSVLAAARPSGHLEHRH